MQRENKDVREKIGETLNETYPVDDSRHRLHSAELSKAVPKDTENRREVAKDEAGWLEEKRRADKAKNGELDSIPSPERDPAAAPLGTDQEAGGAITTPEGERQYDRDS